MGEIDVARQRELSEQLRNATLGQTIFYKDAAERQFIEAFNPNPLGPMTPFSNVLGGLGALGAPQPVFHVRDPIKIDIDWDRLMPVVWTVLGLILALLFW